MPTLSKSRFILVFLIVAFLQTANTARLDSVLAAGAEDQNPPSQKTVSDTDLQEQPVEDEESAPAAIEIDTSKDSPLIKTLYQATRETKEKAILAKLDEARKMIDDGADV